MVDWDKVEGFQWDAGNARKSASKHDVTESEAEQVFFNQPLLINPDVKHSQSESRYHALGKTERGRLLHLTYTLRNDDTLIRVISARPMSRKERIIYAKETEKDSPVQE